MARLRLCGNWEDVALAVGSWKTVASVKAGADQVELIKRVRLATDGIAGDAKPLEFRMQRVTAGTGTGVTVTASKLNETNGTTPRSVFRNNFTAGPTEASNGVLGQDKFHPQGGEYQDFSFEDLEVAQGNEIAVQVKVPSGGTAVNCSGHIIYEE